MDKTQQHYQLIGERTACAHIRRLTTHRDRTERLAVVLLLTKACFDEANKTTGLVSIEFALTGGETFNEKVSDIRMLCVQLPTRYVAEIATAILLPELTFVPPLANPESRH